MLRRSCWIVIKPPPTVSAKSAPANCRLPVVRFCSSSAEPSEKMDKSDEGKHKPPTTASGDAMSDSFGHGYSTRSDDDGFGGIYGGKQSFPGASEEPVAAEEGVKQGSEVKQKESARHQEEATDN